MKRKQLPGILLFALLFAGCYGCKDAETEIGSHFTGYYKITSLVSEKALDLNHDGLASFDLYNEISSPYYVGDGQEAISFYTFDQVGNYAEVRPTLLQSTSTPLILLRIPRQEIAGRTDFGEEPFLMMYTHDMTDFLYTFTSAEDVVLERISEETPHCIQSPRLKRIADNQFTLDFTGTFYDFKTDQWVETPAKAVYQKVDILP